MSRKNFIAAAVVGLAMILGVGGGAFGQDKRRIRKPKNPKVNNANAVEYGLITAVKAGRQTANTNRPAGGNSSTQRSTGRENGIEINAADAGKQKTQPNANSLYVGNPAGGLLGVSGANPTGQKPAPDDSTPRNGNTEKTGNVLSGQGSGTDEQKQRRGAGRRKKP